MTAIKPLWPVLLSAQSQQLPSVLTAQMGLKTAVSSEQGTRTEAYFWLLCTMPDRRPSAAEGDERTWPGSVVVFSFTL